MVIRTNHKPIITKTLHTLTIVLGISGLIATANAGSSAPDPAKNTNASTLTAVKKTSEQAVGTVAGTAVNAGNTVINAGDGVAGTVGQAAVGTVKTAVVAGSTVVDSGKALITNNPLKGVENSATTAATGTVQTLGQGVKTVEKTAGAVVGTTAGAAADTVTTAAGAVVGTTKTGTNTVGTVITAGKEGAEAARNAVSKPIPTPAK